MGRGPCTHLRDMGRGSFARLSDAWSLAEAKLNKSVASTSVGKYFKLDSRKTSFTKELRAGTATFLTMVYIISVNSAILSDSGGPCKPNGDSDNMDKCLSDIKSDYVTATASVAMVGSFAMGCLANLPLALAPAMGSNAYFTYNMVGFRGSGPLSYETALAAVMLEGCLFLLVSALGLRAKLARAIPRPIRLSSAAGIGMFLAFTGLQSHVGLGLVGPSQSTLVTLAACADTDPATGACLGGTTMRSPTFWLGAVGFLVTATCLKRGVKGSMIYGIVFVTLISWIRNTSVTIFPDTPAGDSSYHYFKQVVDFHMISSTAGKMSFGGFFSTRVWVPLVTLLYVDILSTTGSMYSMAEYGGFTDDKGGFEGEYRAFLVDAGSTIVSSALGTTTVTAFLESTAGLKEGGRTGVTAVTVGLYFLLSLFFTPLFTSVPPWAVGPSLVVVGAMMMAVAKEVEWGETGEAVPAFVTMIVMPLTYSISNGIIAGIGVYVAMNAVDYAAGAWGWMRKMREMMAEARNQVSAAAPPPGAEIAAASAGGDEHV